MKTSKKRFRKINNFFVLTLLLLMTAILGSSCAKNGRPASTLTNSPDTTAAPGENGAHKILLAADGVAQYRIVLSEGSSERLISAAKNLQAKLRQSAGCIFSLNYAETVEEKPSQQKEIVIGNCGRTASGTVLSTLKYKDYAAVFLNGQIVLASYSDSYAIQAIQYFSELLSEENLIRENEDLYLMWERNYTHENVSYRPKTVTLGGVDLSAYRIVYPDGNDTARQTATELFTRIGERCGYVLPIFPDSTSETTYEILIGNTARSQSRNYYQSQEAPGLMQYRILQLDGKLLFAGGGEFSTLQAVKSVDGLLSDSGGVLTDISVRNDAMIGGIDKCEADYRFMSYNILVEFDGWGSGGLIPSDVGLRKEIVASLIRNYQPDVLALCEVFETWHGNLPELIADEYEFVCATRRDGACNRSPLVYNKKRLKLIQCGYEDLEQVLTQNRRNITWAIFEDLETQEQFAVLGTHLDSQDAALRLEQATRTAAFAEQIGSAYKVPVILMGDFNSQVGSDPYNAILNRSGLQCAQNASGYGSVDHIFYSREFTLIKADAEKGNWTQYASDHKPIFADLNFGRNDS